MLLLLCGCDCDCAAVVVATPVEAEAPVVPAVVVAPVELGLVLVLVLVLVAGDEVVGALEGLEVLELLDVPEFGVLAMMAPLELDMMSVVATEPFFAVELRNVEALGARMLAIALETPAPERKPADPGVGMIIPMPAASRSIRPSSLSEATLALSCSLRVCRAELLAIERPTLAPNFSTSTCMATIPASISPSTGIHARPRTSRSIRRWSGRPRRNALARCRAASSGVWFVCGCRRGRGCR